MEEGNIPALVNSFLYSLCPGPLSSTEGLQVHPSVGPKDAERRAPLGCQATMRRGLIVAPNEEG